ncbi:hypothetical protein FPCIR_13400, partial [Fusarium pseudocircinatum]
MTDTDPEAIGSHDLLDPRKLKMANRGYYIQSKILHIPDRFGFFFAGPPWLQLWLTQESQDAIVVQFETDVIIQFAATSCTYDHTYQKIRDPVRSPIVKL